MQFDERQTRLSELGDPLEANEYLRRFTIVVNDSWPATLVPTKGIADNALQKFRADKEPLEKFPPICRALDKNFDWAKAFASINQHHANIARDRRSPQVANDEHSELNGMVGNQDCGGRR